MAILAHIAEWGGEHEKRPFRPSDNELIGGFVAAFRIQFCEWSSHEQCMRYLVEIETCSSDKCFNRFDIDKLGFSLFWYLFNNRLIVMYFPVCGKWNISSISRMSSLLVRSLFSYNEYFSIFHKMLTWRYTFNFHYYYDDLEIILTKVECLIYRVVMK